MYKYPDPRQVCVMAFLGLFVSFVLRDVYDMRSSPTLHTRAFPPYPGFWRGCSGAGERERKPRKRDGKDRKDRETYILDEQDGDAPDICPP